LARAKRHYIPGQIWHITHRCHKREFLLKFAKDRHRYLKWLYQARKQYGLAILNYTITSNHVHLLVVDDGGREVIPKAMQLVAGRTGQEYNQRKRRKGAFWEDRYHATAVENGDHLARCLVYIDTNMVRAGAVIHPDQWLHCGYHEIQEPRRKNVLIDYERLKDLIGTRSYDRLREIHRQWVNEYLNQTEKTREEEWSRSIAVGSQPFVDNVKDLLGSRAKGREIIKGTMGYQLRDEAEVYQALFEVENSDIGLDNAYLWDIIS
jgi:putative transposase